MIKKREGWTRYRFYLFIKCFIYWKWKFYNYNTETSSVQAP